MHQDSQLKGLCCSLLQVAPNSDGIQKLLAAEQEASRIVAEARKGACTTLGAAWALTDVTCRREPDQCVCTAADMLSPLFGQYTACLSYKSALRKLKAVTAEQNIAAAACTPACACHGTLLLLAWCMVLLLGSPSRVYCSQPRQSVCDRPRLRQRKRSQHTGQSGRVHIRRS